MNQSIQRQVALGFAATLLALASVAATYYGNLRRLEATTAQVAHGYAVRERLDRLYTLVVDVETAQRGYALTGEESFLEPYPEALGSVGSELAALRRDVEDDPNGLGQHGQPLQQLEVLVERKLIISREIISARRFNGAAEAGELVRRGEGKRVMDQIRKIIHGVKEGEERNLAGSAASQRARMEQAPLIALAGLVIAAGIALLSLFALRRDVTRRVFAEAEALAARDAAEAANHAKSEFLARMSHELRTPLNTVIRFSNVLLKNRSGNLQQGELDYLRRIQSNGRHLLGVINDILDLSRVEPNKVELEVAPVAVDALIRETLAELDGRAEGREVILRADLPTATAPLIADCTRL